MVRSTRFFTLAESLGAVESLDRAPAPDDPRFGRRHSALAVDPGLVRLSVGLEDRRGTWSPTWKGPWTGWRVQWRAGRRVTGGARGRASGGRVTRGVAGRAG